MREIDRIDRLVMLGFMASGKSTVGAALARRLEWSFIDFDLEIERREGRSVGRIVAENGEAYLRDLEVVITAEFERQDRMVMAPGGGWITNPELLSNLGTGTFAVWLSVSAQVTVRRIRADREEHPFKDHTDPIGPIRQMLREREPLYRLADLKVSAERRSAEAIAFEIEQLVRTRGIGRLE